MAPRDAGPARPDRGRDAGFVAKTLALARKDLRVEARARQTTVPMIVFTLTVALILGFTTPERARLATPVIAGFLWITMLFAGLIGFARTFAIEREDGAIDTLLLVPLDRSGLFAAKAGANLVEVLALQAVALPVFALLFDLDIGARGATLAAVVALTDVGFVSVGTLFAALAAQTRSRELLLPVLALPMLVPVFIPAVELSADLLGGRPLPEVAARGWFAVLLCFDIVATTVGALTFEYALE
jgi:heme exporter protein B